MILHSNKYRKVAEILISNLGFGLFVFFLNKFCVFSLVQFNYRMSSLTSLGVGVLLGVVLMILVFVVILCWKLDLFSTLIHSKVPNKQLNRSAGSHQQVRNYHFHKRVYLLLLIVEPVINCTSLVLLSPVSEYHFLVPILVYLSHLVYLHMYSPLLFSPVNKYRLYFTYCMAIMIQSFLMVKRFQMTDT